MACLMTASLFSCLTFLYHHQSNILTELSRPCQPYHNKMQPATDFYWSNFYPASTFMSQPEIVNQSSIRCFFTAVSILAKLSVLSIIVEAATFIRLNNNSCGLRIQTTMLFNARPALIIKPYVVQLTEKYHNHYPALTKSHSRAEQQMH